MGNESILTLKSGAEFRVQKAYNRNKSYSENMDECMRNIENGTYAGSELGNAINSYGLLILFIIGILLIGKWARG